MRSRERKRERKGGGGIGEKMERDVQNQVRYKPFPPKNQTINFGELITTYESNQLDRVSKPKPK